MTERPKVAPAKGAVIENYPRGFESRYFISNFRPLYSLAVEDTPNGEVAGSIPAQGA